MTATAQELMASPEFWIRRIEEQVEYIVHYHGTRPDAKVVLESALEIMERCQTELLKLNVLNPNVYVQ